ncbi:MAG: hypothetical protein ACK4NW_09995, partial [Roseinatronobacter sp.]
TNGRWMRAIARWRRSDHSHPTPSGDSRYRIGYLPAIAAPDGRVAPGFDVYGMCVGTGPIVGVMTGNTHTDEHAGAYMMEAAIDWLISDDPMAVEMRSLMTVYIYPGMNPQARYLGLSRFDAQEGVDSNSFWNDLNDHVVYSKVMRDAWTADLTTVNWSYDFHDSPGNLSYAEVWGEPPSAWKAAANNRYTGRTGKNIQYRTNSGSERNIRAWFQINYAVPVQATIEFGARKVPIFEWQQWGKESLLVLMDARAQLFP